MWNCIFGSFKLFPSSKIAFWPFLKLQKIEFGEQKISWNWFIWFHKFFSLDFFKFSDPLWVKLTMEMEWKSDSKRGEIIYWQFWAVSWCHTSLSWYFCCVFVASSSRKFQKSKLDARKKNCRHTYYIHLGDDMYIPSTT